MMNKPLVSVGIPTYDRPIGLRRTLECITRQTYKNLEIIVSDNCSSNTEVKIVIDEFKDDDNRIQYFRQIKNIYAPNNFKFVLEKANGDYFMWASDDDEWDIYFIEKLVKYLIESPNTGLSMCQVTYQVLETKELFSFPQGQSFYNIPKCNTKRAYINSTQRYGELFYGIYNTKLLQNIDFEAIDIIHPVLINAISKSDVCILNEYLYLKRVTYNVLLWTYLCAKKKSKDSFNSELEFKLVKFKRSLFKRNDSVKTNNSIKDKLIELNSIMKWLRSVIKNSIQYHFKTLRTSIVTIYALENNIVNNILSIFLEVLNLSQSCLWTIYNKFRYNL